MRAKQIREAREQRLQNVLGVVRLRGHRDQLILAAQ